MPLDLFATFTDDNEPAGKLEPDSVLAHRYRLIVQIGRGGMGIVWMAEEKAAERNVVLKFVPRELNHFEDAVAQLKESFQKIHELHHQHICPVLTLDEEPGVGWFHVMKWLDGETLDRYVKRLVGRGKPLPLENVLQILRPVAAALDYSHENGILHRDIKPSNIFIELNAEENLRGVQVIDFGLAAEIQSSLSRVSQIRFDTSGTRPYMAPEQWRGQRQDARTDQYALAVVAYELLCGYLPFDGGDMELLRMAVLQDKPEGIVGVPDGVNGALQKALSKDRKERFESCGEFVEELGKTAVQPPFKSAFKNIFEAADARLTGTIDDYYDDMISLSDEDDDIISLSDE